MSGSSDGAAAKFVQYQQRLEFLSAVQSVPPEHGPTILEVLRDEVFLPLYSPLFRRKSLPWSFFDRDDLPSAANKLAARGECLVSVTRKEISGGAPVKNAHTIALISKFPHFPRYAADLKSIAHPRITPLKLGIIGWLRRFNLNPQDEWLLDAALGTLLEWAISPDLMRPAPLDATVAASMAEMLKISGIEVPVSEIQKPRPLRWKYEGDGTIFFPPDLENEKLDLHLTGKWAGPLRESWESFEDTILKQVLAELRRHKNTIDAHYERMGLPKRLTRNQRHYWWLALFQVGALSPREISLREFGDAKYEHRIFQGIISAARRIGLTRRPSKKKGRPRKQR